MKNIGASVSAGLTQEQKAVKGKEVEEKMKLIPKGTQQAEAKRKKQEERRKMDERDIEANKKCAISMINIIKIK